MKVLVTGANGFVGSTLCAELLSRGHDVSAAVRKAGSAPVGTREILVGDVEESTEWSHALAGQQAVVHLAARVHVLDETAADPLTEFRRVNTAGALTLAAAAQVSGVERFVFLSSIKANGEATTTAPFTVRDKPDPQDPYGLSKLEAERGIEHLSERGSTAFAAVRTPLVYGPGVGGNFRRLLHIVDKRLPIPLAAVKNRRTMVSIWNLVDLIDYLLTSDAPRHQLVLVADSEGLSTASLIRAIGSGIGRPARLVWLPVALLKLAGRLARKQADVERLIGSLEVETGSTSAAFDWTPPLSVLEGVQRTSAIWQDTNHPTEQQGG